MNNGVFSSVFNTSYSVPKILTTRGGAECALFGDSRLAGTHDPNAYGAGVENSVSPAGWIAYLSRGRLQFPYDLNFAVGGDTTSDMLARLASVASCRAPVVLLLAGTNDRGSAALTATQSIVNMTKILNALHAAGKVVILIAEMPRGDSTYTSYRLASTQLAYHSQFRDWMCNTVPRLYENTAVFDVYNLMAVYNSTTGDAILGMHHDGLHPSTVGAYSAATAIASWLNANMAEPPILPRSLSAGYSADNPYGWLNSNPVMNSTGGTPGSGSSGDVAAGWTGARNSALAAGTIAPVLSKVARTNGEWQQVVFSGNTASNTTPQFALYESILTNVTEGDIIEAVGEVEVDASSAGIRAAHLTLRFENPTVYESKSLDQRNASNTLPSAALSGVQRVLPMEVPAGVTVARLRCLVDFVESYTGVSGTVRFGNVGARKVRA